MIKLGITGNIASGKSLIETILRDFNLKTLDTDVVVHELLSKDLNTIQLVKNLFSDINIITNNGFIDRKLIANIVFKDTNKLKKLENILHPKVKEKINEFFFVNKLEQLVGVSVPLLYEADMDNMFDYVLFVAADEDVRLKRLMKRNHLSSEAAKDRMNSQLLQEEKMKKADYVVFNNSDIENVKLSLIKFLKGLNIKTC